MNRKALAVLAVVGVAVLVIAGVAVAAGAAGSNSGNGRCRIDHPGVKVMSEQEGAQADSFACRNMGEDVGICAENCAEVMQGECSGECDQLRERAHNRVQDDSCDGECPQYRHGDPEDSGSAGNEARWSSAEKEGLKAGGSDECLREQED